MRLFVALLLVLAPLQAQEKAAPKAEPKAEPKAAPKEVPAPTNLKVLAKTTNGTEVRQIMRTFTTGLGVQCGYCHIAGNNASDDNPKKDVARRMIALTEKTNALFPDGKMHVTCFTCHRGEAQPKTVAEPKP
jgi:photosynthetic reaction center cytochrome c subunit